MGTQLEDLGGVLLLEGFYERFCLLHVLPDFLPVIVIIRQRGMHLCQGQLGEIGHDFFRRQTPGFMPDHNILHANTGSRDAWSPAADTWRTDNMVNSTRSKVGFMG